MAGRPVRISIIANGRQARAELQRTGASVDALNKNFSRAGKVLLGAFAVSTIARAGRAVLAAGDAYTSQLNKIEALTTAQQRAQVGGITGVAKALEANKAAYAQYGNTVADAAGGVTELVKAGQTLPQALKSVNAALVLAKAGEMDVADAGGLIATALKTWRLPAQRAGDVANYLANAANISTANVSDLAEALKFVAPVAAKTGVSAQQTAAYLAQLSNAGLNGTIAGEGLRRIMLSLQSPVGGAGDALKSLGVQVFNANGKVRPFSDVMTDLSKKLDNVSDARRAHDLRAIFGLTGITPATTLLANVKSIDKYTEGVERAGAAQKLAAANSKGLVGTLRRAGAFLESSGQAAYRAFSPIVDDALRPMVDWLERNDQALGAQAKTIGARVVPALESFGDVLEKSADAAGNVVDDLKPLTPILGDVVDLAKTAADALAAVPTPIKTLAIEAGIAALILPKLAGGAATVGGAFTTMAGRIQAARTELAMMRVDAAWQQGLDRLSASGVITTNNLNNTTRSVANFNRAISASMPAVKSAAGIGGMLGLVQSTKIADEGMRTFAQTASGALTGFAVGGPVGAAIGGGAALLGGLWQATHKANDELKKTAQAKAEAKAALEDLKGTIDETTGAYTRMTRAAVAQRLQESGTFAQLSGSGLNRKQIVDAALGQQSAISKLLPVFDSYNRKIADNKARMEALRPAYEAAAATDRERAQSIADQISSLDRQNRAMQGSMDAFGAQARAASGASAAIKNQDLATRGYVGTLKGLPKGIVTKVKTDGLDGSLNEVKRLAKQYDLTPKQIVTLIKAEGIAPTKSAINSVVSAMRSAAGQSNALGASAGSSWGAGYVSGIAKWEGPAIHAAAAMAAAAHAAAMRAQDSHSPSKKMQQVGKWFSQGFAIGIRRDASKALDAVSEMYERIDKAQDKILDQAPKKQRKRLQKQFKAQNRDIRAIVKTYTATGVGTRTFGTAFSGLREYFTAAALKDGKVSLREVAAAQENLNNQLDDARQRLADAKQAWKDYRDNIRAGIVAFGDITQLGKNGAGNATADGIVKQLQARRDAVKKYAADIEALRKAGLNKTALQQILDAGVDGGLQTAEALLAGGKGVIGTVNSIQAQIDKSGASLGTSMANTFKNAGIQAAQGLVNGLIADQRGLNRVAETLADGMVKAIKKKLKIKSPSRVFRQIGRYNVEGLRIGMDATYVKRTGELTAASLVKGFGTPAMSAVATAANLRASQQAATLTGKLTLTADQVDALRRGRDVVADVSVATGFGARTVL